MVEGSLWQMVFLLFVGLISASALVLPGISISHFLLVLGMYERLMEAFRTFDLWFLVPIGAGLVLGIIGITRFLEYLLNRYPRISYLVILGFVLGSVAGILPGIPNGFTLCVSIFMALAGFFIIYTLAR